MSGATVLASLKALCRDLDAGRSPRPIQWRRVLLPLAVPAALGLALSGCAREDCHDGADNDRDGLVDCADPDCEEALGCRAAPEYAAPMPDREAVDRPEPPPVPAYAFPSHVDDAAPEAEPARPEAGPVADAAPAAPDAAPPARRADGGVRRISPNLKAPLRLKAIPQVRRDPVTVLYACPFV